MNLQKVRAVLFDLDGTLLDTVGDMCTCLNIVLRRFRYPEITLEDTRRLICHGVRRLIAGALPKDVSDEQIDEVLSAYQPIYSERCADATTPYPGAVEFVHKLQKNGYHIGMITNKIQDNAEFLMQRCFPGTSFVLVWGNDGIRPLKPSPESGRLACETLGLSPEEILFVGDGETDVQFARNNGFVACGVSWGYRDPAVLKELGADFVIDRFEELGRMLDAAKGKG